MPSISEANNLEQGSPSLPKRKAESKTDTRFYLIPLILALIFRLPVLLFNDSFRLDEGFSMRFIQPDFWEIVRHATNDSHSPFYTFLLKGWCLAFGTGEIAARSLSFLFGIMAIFTLYELGKQLYGELTGSIAAGLGAISPLWVWYSTETRMYTIWLTFICINSLFFFYLVKTPSLLYMLGYALSGALVIYTQYIGILILPLHLSYIFFSWKKSKKLVWWLAQSYTLIAILFIPWVVALACFYTGFESDKLPLPTFNHLFRILIQLFSGYITDSTPYRLIEPVLGIIFLAMVLITLTVLIPSILATPKVKAYTKVFLLSPFAIFGGFFIFSFFTSVMEVRNLIFLTPFVYLLIGNLVSLSWKQKSLQRTMIAGFVLVFCAWATYTQTTDTYNTEKVNYREAASYVASLAKSGDMIVLDAYFIEPVFNYYYNNPSGDPIVFAPTSTEAHSRGEEFINERLTPPPNTRIIWVVQSYWERPESPTQKFYASRYPVVKFSQISSELRVLGYWAAES